ncbi:MAG: hypothetical protein ABIG64_04715 [Candidatus Omnitrophota bacterium]
MKNYKLISFLLVLVFVFGFGIVSLLAQVADNLTQTDLAGELFSTPVPMNNYYFAKQAVVTFGAKWRGIPQTREELEDMVWQELVFSFEAYRRAIEASEDEVDAEIEKILTANKVDFSWRTDKEKFQNWTKDTLRCTIESFKNQMAHLVKLEKLRNEVLDSINPEVTEEEAYQKFLNEYNTLLVELREFVDIDEAEKFYQAALKEVTEKDQEQLIWQDLIYSDEVFKRKIEISDEEFDKTISFLLRDKEARFKWQEDAETYTAWVKENFDLSLDDFQILILQLRTVDKLIEEIFLGNQPQVEISQYQNLLDESISINQAYERFIEERQVPDQNIFKFKTFNEAEDFYEKINRVAGFWEEEKRKQPKEFKQPGFTALDFLINMWGFRQVDADKMIDKEIGSYYPPAPIYKGYGVFKILKIRKADKSEYPERKDSYFEKMKSIKKYQGFQDWAIALKDKANIKVYIK